MTTYAYAVIVDAESVEEADQIVTDCLDGAHATVVRVSSDSLRLDWTPLPGHWPGQGREHVFYRAAEYRGMHCEIWQRREDCWEWSFYDDDSYDPDLAVARGQESTRGAAERELLGYIDSHVWEKEASR